MKKSIFIVVSLLIVLACFSVAVVEYHNHKVTQVAAVNSAVKTANDTLRVHDAVNARNMLLANNQIVTLQNQKATICVQVKTAKLVQPLCQ